MNIKERTCLNFNESQRVDGNRTGWVKAGCYVIVDVPMLVQTLKDTQERTNTND